MDINDDDVEEPLGNPAPPPDVDLEKLRGDRIGDTVFSGKWCIQTVMKLMKSDVVINPEAKQDSVDVVDMEEELQNEVGALWDMTSNVQVCEYLHSVGAIESISYVITNSRCPRATEMCVGMLANIIYHKELWDIVKDDASFFFILIQLLMSTDQPVLLEVNRFFNTALCHPSSGVFYSTLDANGQLVTQELLRILSGSTNADLLKQAVELVLGLMYRDEDDTHFNMRFANPDFVMAVIEASKELGWSHESVGQNTTMEIFYCFTTYGTGIEAIGSFINDISTSSQTYLRTLCLHGLSLASNCSVLTSMLSTLQHAMTRSTPVRDSFLTSPSFLHCVLITLVALYRKLGLYHAISHVGNESSSHQKQPKHHQRRHHHHHHHHRHHHQKNRQPVSGTSWQSQEEKEENDAEGITTASKKSPGKSSNLGGSWSERAFAAAAQTGDAGDSVRDTGATFRTPEASPRQAFLAGGRSGNELNVSWSERRLDSPLMAGEDNENTKWKRPLEGRRLLKKKQDNMKAAEVAAKSDAQVSETQQGDQDEERAEEESNTHYSATVTSSDSLKEESDAQNVKDSSKTFQALKIQNSRLSGGFTPSEHIPGEIGECGASVGDQRDRGEHNLPDDDVSSLTEGKGSGPRGTAVNECKSEQMSRSPHSGIPEAKKDKQVEDMDLGFDFIDKDDNEDDDDEGNDEDGDSNNKMRVRNDKYQMLLEVIRDLLVDYFQALSKMDMAESDSGPESDRKVTPDIKVTVGYLDERCSGTELGALTKCILDQQENNQGKAENLFSGIESLCDRFKARRLKSFLVKDSTT